MKKTLFALALAGIFTGAAHAQSSVTIYGIADTGFIKETGSDVEMGNNHESRIGFKGSEDLGNGYKAIFLLEKRINLNDGTNLGEVDWDGGANVGISGPFGTVRLGRVNELPTETLRMLDPFDNDSIANMPYSTQRSSRISNTVRYDSPNISGFQIGATYTLGRNTRGSDADNAFVLADADNDGYAGSILYDNGPVTLLGNWSRLDDSNNSYRWNLGGAYAFGNATVSLGYEKNRDKSLGDSMDFDTWIAGLKYRIGQGTVNASFNRADIDDGSYNGHASKYALGYTYDLSRRTALYGMLAWTDFHDNHAAWYFGNRASESGKYDESITGVQIGITHRF